MMIIKYIQSPKYICNSKPLIDPRITSVERKFPSSSYVCCGSSHVSKLDGMLYGPVWICSLRTWGIQIGGPEFTVQCRSCPCILLILMFGLVYGISTTWRTMTRNVCLWIRLTCNPKNNNSSIMIIRTNTNSLTTFNHTRRRCIWYECSSFVSHFLVQWPE